MMVRRADSLAERLRDPACACGGACPKCRAEQPGHERENNDEADSYHSWNKAVPAIEIRWCRWLDRCALNIQGRISGAGKRMKRGRWQCI